MRYETYDMRPEISDFDNKVVSLFNLGTYGIISLLLVLIIVELKTYTHNFQLITYNF